MLKPFKYEKIEQIDRKTNKVKVSYACRYDNCEKIYNKTWNLIDHVRMHEGVRPYQCPECPKAFTQKGNLKKHEIQHLLTTLKERKRFKCGICNKGYTERYNLEVRFFITQSKYHIGSYGDPSRQRPLLKLSKILHLFSKMHNNC